MQGHPAQQQLSKTCKELPRLQTASAAGLCQACRDAEGAKALGAIRKMSPRFLLEERGHQASRSG